MEPATRSPTAIKDQVGSARPNHNPMAMPARPAWEIVSLKKAIRRAVRKTPRSAHTGERNSATRMARCIQGSVSMVMVVMVMVVGRHVDAVSLTKGLGIHHFLGRTF